MPEFWKVTWDGRTLFKGFDTREQAAAKAEKWQGQRYKSGMLKHGDKGDYFEVERDVDREREWDAAYDLYKRGKPQTYIIQGG